MSRINLNGGAYKARSVIAAAQRCLNLMAEPIAGSEDEPGRMAYYPTPGLRLLQVLPQGPIRGIRQTTLGVTFVVAGSGVYQLSADLSTATLLGSITPNLTTPVSMSDNGLTLDIVDGSAMGWQVTLANGAFAQIIDTTGVFEGADRVDYLDTYFLFNKPATPQFLATLSLSNTFDPLYFANKESYSDLLVALVVAKREIWLIGDRTTEVWYNSGAADFPFASQPGVFIDQGCCAKYSVATINNAVFWLGQDRRGVGIVLQGAGYDARRISTFAIENAIAGYKTITDAVGWAYQIAGHSCYVLTFPTADRTWVFDLASGEWHEWCWLDGNGHEHRHRGMCAWSVGGQVVVGDWQNGNLYALDRTVFTDNGAPIKRERGFPHLEGTDGNRMIFTQFLANFDTGTLPATDNTAEPMLYLSWSDDRGHSWGNRVGQSMGASGEYLTQAQWQRLGLSRSRVFKLEWSTPTDTALLGAFVDALPARS